MKALIVFTLGLFLAFQTSAAPGNKDKGKGVYEMRCLMCHGVEGDGAGPAGELLNPPPRDFTAATYKYKTTYFDDAVPNDEDIFRMIKDGMPGTAMPGWADMLSDQDMWDLVAYLKVFGELEEEKPEKQVDYGTEVASSPESIAEGKKLFLDGDRCSECHGARGKGDAIKKLKDDNGARTWPRNLTKPWTFRAGDTPKDIYTRISGGIPSTQMPSFADPVSKKKLSVEQRWHVANYAASLGATPEAKARAVDPANTVIKAMRIEGDLPGAPEDAKWAGAPATTFFLVPQIILKQRFFKPANDTITVKALYNQKDIALHLEWDDRTKSIPGDEKAQSLSEPGLASDGVAVQVPLSLPNDPEDPEKPYFVMGDAAHPVSLWHWTSGAKGMDKVTPRQPEEAGLRAKGSHADGTWRVVITRALKTKDTAKDIQIGEGRFIPIAFSAWDGSNGEKGSKRVLSTWYWLQLEAPVGSGPMLWAVFIALLILAAEIWWQWSANRRRREEDQ